MTTETAMFNEDDIAHYMFEYGCTREEAITRIKADTLPSGCFDFIDE